MYIVPKTNDAPIVCPESANKSESYTSHFVPVPKGLKPQLVEMKAGRHPVLQRQPDPRFRPQPLEDAFPPLVHLALCRG
jgi:hypothetical protein